MKNMFAVAAVAGFVAIGSANVPLAATSARTTSQVMVHCPRGDTSGFVTPPRVRIAVGDSVEWRMTGAVVSDTLVIMLKDSTQRWPFTGNVPRGRTAARTGRAASTGTYAYAVHLSCRQPGGGTRPVVIDPDIIIE